MVEGNPPSANAIIPTTHSLLLKGERIGAIPGFAFQAAHYGLRAELRWRASSEDARLHIGSCFDESQVWVHSGLATKGICDTASQYKTPDLDQANGLDSMILIEDVVF